MLLPFCHLPTCLVVCWFARLLGGRCYAAQPATQAGRVGRVAPHTHTHPHHTTSRVTPHTHPTHTSFHFFCHTTSPSVLYAQRVCTRGKDSLYGTRPIVVRSDYGFFAYFCDSCMPDGAFPRAGWLAICLLDLSPVSNCAILCSAASCGVFSHTPPPDVDACAWWTGWCRSFTPLPRRSHRH